MRFEWAAPQSLPSLPDRGGVLIQLLGLIRLPGVLRQIADQPLNALELTAYAPQREQNFLHATSNFLHATPPYL
jgi:hypothetical protein